VRYYLSDFYWWIVEICRDHVRLVAALVAILILCIGTIVVDRSQSSPHSATTTIPVYQPIGTCAGPAHAIEAFIKTHSTSHGPLSPTDLQSYITLFTTFQGQCPHAQVTALNAHLINPWKSVLSPPTTHPAP
jgi:hypothetical protein